MRPIIMTKADWRGKDGIWAHFFVCPICDNQMLMLSSRYCSKCGIGIVWNTTRDEVDKAYSEKFHEET